MLIISHRINTRAALAQTPKHYGVEIDLRSENGTLILQHDPMTSGEDFEAWLAEYRHAMLVLNTKEEGLERLLIERMKAKGIADYFFLDTTPPFVLRLLRGQLSTDGAPERRVALRLSEYESIESIHAHAAADLRNEWIWVDFTETVGLHSRRLVDEAIQLQGANYRICLVSPELYGPHRASELAHLQELLGAWRPDAVCTKAPAQWESLA